MALTLKQSAAVACVLSGSRLGPRGIASHNPATSRRHSVIRRFQEEGKNVQPGSRAPKNPVTGKPLETISNPQKEGYQAAEFTRQGPNARARIDQQIEGSPGGLAFGEMQAFDGLGPEVINSRLAMLGFVIAAFFEVTTGKDVFQQVKDYPLLTIATFVVFISASWIPFQQGASYNVKSGWFTPKREITNGRVAMCGFLGLVLNEAYFGHAFFPQLLHWFGH